MSLEKLADVFSGLGNSIKSQLDKTKLNISESELSNEQKSFFNEQIKAIEKGIADDNIESILTSINKLNDSDFKS